MTRNDHSDVCSTCRKPRQQSNSLAISQRIYVCNCDRTADSVELFEPVSDSTSTSASAYFAPAYQQLELNLKSSRIRPQSWASKNATGIIVASTVVTIVSAVLVCTELFHSDTRYDAELTALIAESEQSQRTMGASMLAFEPSENSSGLDTTDLKFSGFERTKIPCPRFVELQNLPSARDTLMKIHLNDCTITDPKAFNPFARFPKIEGLMVLNGTGLTEETVKNICNSMPTLKTVSVEFSDMSGASLKHVASLKKLEELYLRGLSTIQDRDTECLVHTRLIRLDIGKTPITDRGLLILAKIKTLHHLRLGTGGGITTAGLERFKQLRPDCIIKLD